jgi:hypothetical protein
VLFAVVHDKRKAQRKAADARLEQLDDDTPSHVESLPEPLESWSDTT